MNIRYSLAYLGLIAYFHSILPAFTFKTASILLKPAVLVPKSVLFRSKLFFSIKSSTKTIKKMSDSVNNPFLAPYTTEHGIPPFTQIRHEHYEPAFEVALKEHMNDIKEIVENSDEPTFDNTISKFDRSGDLLNRVSLVFYNLCSSDCPPELQAVQLKMAAPLAAHSSAIYM